jgi:hypothetical protein
VITTQDEYRTFSINLPNHHYDLSILIYQAIMEGELDTCQFMERISIHMPIYAAF